MIERCARLHRTRMLHRKKDEAEEAVPLASKTSKQPGSCPGTGARQGLGVDHGGCEVLFVKGGDGCAVHGHLQEDSIEKREEGLNKPEIRGDEMDQVEVLVMAYANNCVLRVKLFNM